MKAMIFAAGLGTRLKPLTNSKPKALVEIKGVTLLELNIRKLAYFGFNEIVVNVHHFADQVKDFLEARKFHNLHIQVSDESDALLDTGGGLLKAAGFFDDGKPFLVHNVDVLTDFDLKAFYQMHVTGESLATLAVRERETSRYLLFDDFYNLSGWMNKATGEQRLSSETATLEDLHPYAFSGIQVINPELFSLMGRSGKFSIIDVYLDIMEEHCISAFDHSDTIWLDVGKPESLQEAESLISE